MEKIKSSTLTFHETFSPEMIYISKILSLAAENYSGTKFEISECSGIPTGKQKGKVEPHIRYAAYMGLVDFVKDQGTYLLNLTSLGSEVFQQDPYLQENISHWLCHYEMTKKAGGAPQWEYLIHDAYPGLENPISQERIFSSAELWCDVARKDILRKVFHVVKGSYSDGCFSTLNFLTWNDSIEFLECAEKQYLLYVYAYALFDSWDRVFPDRQEISDFDLKDTLGFDRIFGFSEATCNNVIDSLMDEGFLTVNRQMFPATLIRTVDTGRIIPMLYSRLM